MSPDQPIAEAGLGQLHHLRRLPMLYHDTGLAIEEHYTDTGGVSYHVFGLCHLFGFRFAPRMRDIKERKLYLLPDQKAPFEPQTAGRRCHRIPGTTRGASDPGFPRSSQPCAASLWPSNLRLPLL